MKFRENGLASYSNLQRQSSKEIFPVQSTIQVSIKTSSFCLYATSYDNRHSSISFKKNKTILPIFLEVERFVAKRARFVGGIFYILDGSPRERNAQQKDTFYWINAIGRPWAAHLNDRESATCLR